MTKDNELIRMWTPCCNRRVRGVILIEDKESHRRVCPKCKVEYDVEIKVLTDTSVQIDWFLQGKRRATMNEKPSRAERAIIPE